MKQFLGAILALGFLVCRASAKDCTWSNEFQVARSQVWLVFWKTRFCCPYLVSSCS